MGRPRKPTSLLEKTGAFVKDPQRKRNGEPPAIGVAVMPKFLKGKQVKLWETYAPICTAMGTLASGDAHQFATLCCLWAELEAGPERMQSARIAQMRALAESFGLTASARAKLSVKDADETKDPAEEYFKQPVSGSTLRQ